MNSKIVSSTKKINALFLAIVLVVGIITLASPSFMTAGIAQGQPYYSGMDSDRKSYESNSYDSTDYGIDKDRKAYGTDNYKPKYPSDGKDDRRDKSKDTKNVDIKKIKCINTNLNINGENAGNVSIGNKGAAADGGYVGGGYSYVDDDSDRYGSGDGYYNDGYNNYKKDNGFDCIINNNNTNINTVGGGNQTEPLTCEECFTENLSPGQLNNLTSVLSSSDLRDLEGLCEALSNSTLTNQEKIFLLSGIFINAGITVQTDIDAVLRVLKCLDELGLIIPPDLGLPNSMR